MPLHRIFPNICLFIDGFRIYTQYVCLFVCFFLYAVLFLLFKLKFLGGCNYATDFALSIIITIKLQSGGLLVAYLLTFQSHPNTHNNSLYFVGYPAMSGEWPVCRNHKGSGGLGGEGDGRVCNGLAHNLKALLTCLTFIAQILQRKHILNTKIGLIYHLGGILFRRKGWPMSMNCKMDAAKDFREYIFTSLYKTLNFMG